MMRVKERRPEQRIQAQVKAQKEAKLGRVKQGWRASRKGAKERTKRSGMRRRPCLSSLRNERQGAQKKDLTAAGAYVPGTTPNSPARSASVLFASERMLAGFLLPLSSTRGEWGSDAPGDCRD